MNTSATAVSEDHHTPDQRSAGTSSPGLLAQPNLVAQSSLMARSSLLSRLTDRWIAFRNRQLMSVAFQDWAASFPLTRPFAQKRARALFDLCAGFVYTQTLLATVRLDLLGKLVDGPRTVSDIARAVDLPVDAADRLVRAAASVELLQKTSGGSYALGDLGAALLGNPGIVEMVEHHSLLYTDLSDPVALLRGEIAETELNRFWPYTGGGKGKDVGESDAGTYSALMSASQAFMAAEILHAYPFARHSSLLDVGGGAGTFVRAAAKAVPSLRFKVFDLPPVAARANKQFAADGLGSRAEAFGGSFFDDPLPEGADIATLIRVLFDHPDESALAILKAVYAALPPGGTLIVAEPMAGIPGAEPIGDSYFGFYLLAMGRGRCRTQDELSELMRAAGFEQIKRRRTRRPLLTGVLVACKGEAAVTLV